MSSTTSTPPGLGDFLEVLAVDVYRDIGFRRLARRPFGARLVAITLATTALAIWNAGDADAGGGTRP